jgi:exo-1,4-beta-D-glucosaminidase
VYWESQVDDDLGPASNDDQFRAKWVQLGDMSALNTMPAARVGVSGAYEEVDGETHAHISLRNNSEHVAFFVRAEITMDSDGGEVLPIRYDDNYITVFPRETRTMDAVFVSSLLAGHKPALRLEDYRCPSRSFLFWQERRNRRRGRVFDGVAVVVCASTSRRAFHTPFTEGGGGH